MTLQQFVLVAGNASADQFDGLFARCGDVVVEQNPHGRRVEIKFDRDAPTLTDAVVSGLRDLEAVGIVPLQMRDDDDLVTLRVIAERVGRSGAAVRLWSVGRTGPGGFPAPVDAGLDTTFYRWGQVAPWLRESMGMPVDNPEPVITAVNLALQLRALAPLVSRMELIRSLFAA